MLRRCLRSDLDFPGLPAVFIHAVPKYQLIGDDVIVYALNNRLQVFRIYKTRSRYSKKFTDARRYQVDIVPDLFCCLCELVIEQYDACPVCSFVAAEYVHPSGIIKHSGDTPLSSAI